MAYRLSPSKLNLFRDCPRCFWLATVKKINRPRGPMASIVIKMDSIIKHYFDKYRERGELPPLVCNEVKGCLPKDMPKTLYHKENDSVTLMGRPDDYLEIEGGFIVPFDHKTKSKRPESNHPAYLLQMDTYSYLLKANGYKTTNKAYLAYYYPCDCDLHEGMELHCTVMDVSTNTNRAKKLIEQAINVLNGDMPEPGKDCEFCKWWDMEIVVH